MRRTPILVGLLAGLIAGSARAADPIPDIAPDPAAEPRLEGRWLGLVASDVPAALWWAGPAQRDSAGPDTLGEALAGIPGLIVTPAPGNGTAALIVRHGRSQSDLGFGPVAQPGAPLLLAGLFDFDLLLAAPAGGLGGAAGELSLSLRRPGAKLAGLGEFAAGAFGSRRGLARLDVPVTKGVRLGLGGHIQHDLGWLQNTATGERLNRGLRAGLAGTLDIDLSPSLSVALTSLYARSKAGNLPAFACDPNLPANCDGRFTSIGQRPPSPQPAQRWGSISPDLATMPMGQRADMALHDLRLVHAGDTLRLELVGALARQTGQLGLDFSADQKLAALATPAGLASNSYGLIARTVDDSKGLDLIGQVDLGQIVVRAGAGVRAAQARRDAADTLAGRVLADRRISQNRDSLYGFGQMRLEAGGGLALEAGVRVDRQTLALVVSDRSSVCTTNALACLAPAGPARQQRTLVTPEFAVSWAASPQWLLFARSARSARLPGWNLLARSSAELVLLPAETGWHHHAGVKADLWSGRVRLEASGFAARTQALVSPLFGIDPLAIAVAATQRLNMRNHGADMAITARPIDGLELAATLGWQQARWTGPVPATVPVTAPMRPLYAPDTMASLSAAWRQPLPGTGSVLVPRVTARWRSAMTVGPTLGLIDGVSPGGWQVAAALQLEIPDGGWLMSLECENCLDQTLTDGAVVGLPTLNPPRWWQLRFTRRF
ncbi:TonB-dependent receptor [Sandarakinorhabdus sp.]|uniref:TonB-dependent receptor n=1 Tax=Sandarakinorhabdus sp. TaxID=1916663 RepID=UPI00286D97CC|nr:TonB-dependent receptor [Sandarakinorhabdus sp.]